MDCGTAKGGLAMTSMIIEAVVVAFCVGGVMGALVTLQLVAHKLHEPSGDPVKARPVDRHR